MPQIVAYTTKSVKFLFRIIYEQSIKKLKINIADVWQIEVERQWPPCPPLPPQWLRTFYDKGQDSLFSKKTTLNIE